MSNSADFQQQIRAWLNKVKENTFVPMDTRIGNVTEQIGIPIATPDPNRYIILWAQYNPNSSSCDFGIIKLTPEIKRDLQSLGDKSKGGFKKVTGEGVTWMFETVKKGGERRKFRDGWEITEGEER
jgi:hypothetical protein